MLSLHQLLLRHSEPMLRYVDAMPGVAMLSQLPVRSRLSICAMTSRKYYGRVQLAASRGRAGGGGGLRPGPEVYAALHRCYNNLP